MTQHERPTHPTVDPSADPTRTEGLDPGAFVGQRPERQAASIPGGVQPQDERISSHSSQIAPDQDRPAPREREAGQDR